MKSLPEDKPNDFGCPFTEMRSRREAFEAAHQSLGLNFHMKDDAPHYSMGATRIAFTTWADANKVIQFPGGQQ